MVLLISIAHRQAILAAAASSREEVCGLLLGEGDCVTHCVPCANVAADPARRFEVDPVALLAAYRRARAGGPQVIGHYHSHPGGAPCPSPRDADAAAADGSFWIIAGGGVLTAWRAGADGAVHGRFDAVEMADAPGCAGTGCAGRGERPQGQA
jgi:proteasome lid subunit RPN8/RPN11